MSSAYEKHCDRRVTRRPLSTVLVVATALCVSYGAAFAQGGRPPAIVTVCARCHGSDGITGTVVTPNLAGQKSIYLRQQLLAFRKGTRKHPDMKVISRDLTDREINQIVTYYSALQP